MLPNFGAAVVIFLLSVLAKTQRRVGAMNTGEHRTELNRSAVWLSSLSLISNLFF